LSVGNQIANTQADGQTFIKYIILELDRERWAILSFVQIDTSNGRFTRRSLHIAEHVQRSSAYWPAYCTSEDDLLLNQI